MIQKTIEYIKALSPLFGPSTREQEVQRWLCGHFLQEGIEVEGDSAGNLWTKTERNGQLSCALVAHADEIGIQITSIEDPGIARFRKIGGLRATSLIGQKLKFKNSDGVEVTGIIGSDPMQDNGTENGIILRTSDLWVDIGARSKEEFESKLSIGDFGVFDVGEVSVMSRTRLCGKALDDRTGVALALAAYEEVIRMENIAPVFISTVQEELSLYGAKALPVDVDVAIVLDVDFCSDTPSAIASTTDLNLGCGAGICVSADTSPVLLKIVRDISVEKNIPLQTTLGRNFSGGTDAAALRLKNATATIVIGIPLRYMHTAREVVDINDLKEIQNLIAELVRRLSVLKDKTDLIPWK